jgi:hypothetical protein
MPFIEVTRCRFFVQPHTHYLYEADINSQHIKEETCDIMHRRVDIGDNVNSRTWQDVTPPTWDAPILQPLNSGATISATFNYVNTTNTSSGTTVADTSIYGTSLLTPVFHSERVRLDPSVLGGNFYEGAPLPIPEGDEPIPETPNIPPPTHHASTCLYCRGNASTSEELEEEIAEEEEEVELEP